MNMCEIDWRIEPLYAVIVGIDAGLKAIEKRIDKEDGFDGLTAREHAEPLLGLGFVAAQTYALGTWADLNQIRMSQGKPKLGKAACYKCDLTKFNGNATRIEVLNATANYFKHHDEWSGWPTNPTTKTLDCVGITQLNEFPCIDVTELLCGKSWEFVVVHEIVREWRVHALSTLG